MKRILFLFVVLYTAGALQAQTTTTLAKMRSLTSATSNTAYRGENGFLYALDPNNTTSADDGKDVIVSKAGRFVRLDFVTKASVKPPDPLAAFSDLQLKQIGSIISDSTSALRKAFPTIYFRGFTGDGTIQNPYTPKN